MGILFVGSHRGNQGYGNTTDCAIFFELHFNIPFNLNSTIYFPHFVAPWPRVTFPYHTHRNGPPNIEGMITLKVDNVPYNSSIDDLRRVFEK